MLPRWHIILGGIFTAVLWVFAPEVGYINLALVFLSSFLIDFDHYVASYLKTRNPSLHHSFEYHRIAGIQEQIDRKKGIKKRGDFHFFHTIEFHILIAFLGVIWTSFFFIFIGMIFHSLLDMIDMLRRDVIYRREYFFFNWLRKKF